ncbi:MAG: DUF5596 domain-containing protein [Clostridia bacterium]|nr:DUF5596 domain-containing protein [Clostridia bacterium]
MEKEKLRSRAEHYARALELPTDAIADILAAFDKIAADGACFAEFSAMVTAYEQQEGDWHFTPMLDACREICERCAVHEYTGGFLLHLCLCDGLLAHYRARGIDEQIFWSSIADLAYKMEECRLVKGINGSFVCPWFDGFFKLTRFALGRLQFELEPLKNSYTCAGRVLPAGRLALSVHIPRTGTRLAHSEVEASYRMAKEFFAKEFAGGPTVFTCASWLLDPWNLTVLSEQSNLYAFCKDYEIVKVSTYQGYEQVWRLFDCAYTGDPDALPQDSSLRRAYVARMKRGETLGSARGIFLMD